MGKNFLAFDLGASSGRAIIGKIDKDKKLTLKEIHRFENGPVEKDGSLFWNFHSLIDEIKTGLKKALDTKEEITGIGIDTWGVDYLFIKNSGEIIRLPYHYRDKRTDNIPDEVFKIIPEHELYRATGIQLMQLNTIYQLFAHKKFHPEDFEDSQILFIPDALTYMLCGCKKCEYTEASTSNLLNAKTRKWDFELIDRLGFPRSIFPEIASPCTLAGMLRPEICKELSCKAVPVYHVGSHDTASAVASVPASEDKTWVYISCGTWALLGAELDAPILTEEARKINFTNEGGLNGKIRFLTNIMGTWLLQESRRTWKKAGKEFSYAEMEEMARKAEGFKWIVDPNHPDFLPPGNMPERICNLCVATGQGRPEKTEDIIRTIYDSLAVCFKKKLDNLNELRGNKCECIHIVGGGTQAKLLMQLTADCTNIPVIAGPVEATAIGNILAQAMASGEVNSLAEARSIVKNSFELIEYIPKKNSKLNF